MEEKEINSKDVVVYELGYHMVPTVEESNLSEEVSKLHALLVKHKATIVSEAFPELKNLAFKMSKQIENKYSYYSKGYFGWIKFEMSPSNILDVDNMVRMLQVILRYIILKTVKENTIFTPKIVNLRNEIRGEAPVSDTEEEVEVKISEEEIEKSIDDIVIA